MSDGTVCAVHVLPPSVVAKTAALYLPPPTAVQSKLELHDTA
ncbi:MAG: hypothetical protein ACR2MN_14090 [Acidimicrobiales bacterium]